MVHMTLSQAGGRIDTFNVVRGAQWCGHPSCYHHRRVAVPNAGLFVLCTRRRRVCGGARVRSLLHGANAAASKVGWLS
jgi:hypothetical protein